MENENTANELNTFMEFAIEELTNERDFLKNENMALKFKYFQMEKTLEELNVELDSKKAIENENVRLQQLNAELEATNKKHLEKISGWEKQQEAARHVHDKEKKAFESEIIRLNQAKYELETSNKKQLEKISTLEKEKAARDAEKKALQGENNRLVHAFAELEAKYKNHLNKISDLEKQQQATLLVRDREKKTPEPQVAEMRQNKYVPPQLRKALETTINEMKQSHDHFEPLVVKKIVIDESQNVWKCYSTLDGNEKSANLSLAHNSLFVDGKVSQKKLILDGCLSQYEADPFSCRRLQGFCASRNNVSYLLQKVVSCNLSDLFLHNQTISWREFEKLVSSRTIKNLYLDSVDFIDYQYVPVEDIIEKVPNIKKFAYFHNSNITKEKFVNLLELPVFAKLREFKIGKISFHDFDAQSFLAFMKKYPCACFTLTFHYIGPNIMAEFQKMERMLLSHARTPFKLQLKL